MSRNVDRLVDIIAKLRGPDGCPWDREQTHKSLMSSLLEETYEFFEGVETDNTKIMKEELGDILLQIVFHSQLANEKKQFSLDDVAHAICEKLIHRHPHVFGDEKVADTTEVLQNWEAIKRKEKGKEDRKYIVDGIPKNLPALSYAQKIQIRVARVGFDWKEIKPVLDKVEEEFSEFREAVENNDLDHASEELGDILFALVNLARHKKICAEDALRATIRKFSNRFKYIEDHYNHDNDALKKATLEELDVIWEQSKKVVG